MSVSLFTKYCLDTDSLINLSWRRYPPAVYPDLFPRIDRAFASEILIAPREVRRELKNGSHGDELQQWVTDNPRYFADPDDAQVALMTQLLTQVPAVCDLRKRRPVDADPWVIVLAQTFSLTVVTSESQVSDKKIPHFCRQVGVRVLDIDGFFSEMGWSFNLGGGISRPCKPRTVQQRV